MPNSKRQQKEMWVCIRRIAKMCNETYGPPDPKVVEAVNPRHSKRKKAANSNRVADRSRATKRLPA